jgi:TPP-dependent pyruvate/acetoin dehydrogenase alpha subunit
VNRVDVLRRMRLIRAFEAALAARPDAGFQLLSAGEEAVAVGLCAALAAEDQVLTGGRSIGFALARGLPPGPVMAELLGRVAGPNQGRAGRGHLSWPAYGFFGAHAVVAGNIAVAAGVALARRMGGAKGIAACVFGDGACGAGALHETLNIAALWRLPVLFVCNNNQFAISTRPEAALAPRAMTELAGVYGIPARRVDGMDVSAVAAACATAAARVRDGGGPAFLECASARFLAHSTSARETRKADELRETRARCPIMALEAALLRDGEISDPALERMEAELAAEIAAAIAFAEGSPFPDAEAALADAG